MAGARASQKPAPGGTATAEPAGVRIDSGVREGDRVQAGAEIARVADQKLALQMQALDSRIKSLQAQRDQARAGVLPSSQSTARWASERTPSSRPASSTKKRGE